MSYDNIPPELYAEKLLRWYDVHARILPWRIPPEETKRGKRQDAYRVWLSEIMLQQTTVEAVKPYFAKFMQKWPNLAALSNAPLDDILKAWAGLGYYSRARNLKACADRLMADYDGKFPQTAAELRCLPGIGAYTSAAIAAIAFDEPCAVVDANIERVIARLFQVETPLPAAKAEIHRLCQSIAPPRRAGDFAQAMMDLGAGLCAVKQPNCLLCPARDLCRAHKAGIAANLPKKAPKRAREERAGAAFIVVSDGKIFLRKRAANGLLGGMTEPPNYFTVISAGGENPGDDLRHAPFPAEWIFCGRIIHIFTHFRLTLNVYKAYYHAHGKSDALPPRGRATAPDARPRLRTCGSDIIAKQDKFDDNTAGFWLPLTDLPHEALPTLFKKAISCALPDIFKPKQKIK